jgi:hypothetical protein
VLVHDVDALLCRVACGTLEVAGEYRHERVRVVEHAEQIDGRRAL